MHRKIIVSLVILLFAPAASVGTAEETPQERSLLPAHALECGAPTLDVTDYALVGMSLSGARHPDIPPDVPVLTFTLEQWRCIYPHEDALIKVGTGLRSPAAPLDYMGWDAHPERPAHVHEGVTALSHHGSPMTYGTQGYLKVIILLPNQGDTLYPEGVCNSGDVRGGLDALMADVGPLNSWNPRYDLWCYHDAGWSTGGIRDVGELMNQMHAVVETKWAWMVDEQNEAVMGYVREASNNGAAWQPDKYSLIAEHREGGADAWEDAVVAHEIGHNFNAYHYPDDGDLKNVCVSTASVMNYCWMGMHHMYHDADNRGRVRSQYWSWA